mgnify:FL=1
MANAIPNSDAVTAVSHSLKKDTLRLFNINNDIKVIHNFIDITKYDSTICERSHVVDGNEKIISHISNFRPVKRIADVIDIFYKIQEKVEATLLMVGDGPEKINAEKQVEKLGISEKVKFLGNSSDVNKILCMSDLFLLPSETESFGLAALEAMAAKTPVISTNSGGLAEVNVDGVTGFLSNVGDTDAMSEKAIYILEDEDRLKEFKKNACTFAQQFSIDTILPQYEEMYRMVKEGCC